MKRGELSMEVIIIAAIAILVLVILTVLIIRAARDTGEQTGCTGVGGTCMDECTEGYGRSEQSCSDGGVCCIPVTVTPES